MACTLGLNNTTGPWGKRATSTSALLRLQGSGTTDLSTSVPETEGDNGTELENLFSETPCVGGRFTLNGIASESLAGFELRFLEDRFPPTANHGESYSVPAPSSPMPWSDVAPSDSSFLNKVLDRVQAARMRQTSGGTSVDTESIDYMDGKRSIKRFRSKDLQKSSWWRTSSARSSNRSACSSSGSGVVVGGDLLNLARRISFGLDRTKLQVGYHAPNLNKFTITDNIETKERLEFFRQITEDPYCKRAMGTMVGMAVGDAVGSHFEFISVRKRGPDCMFDPQQLKNIGALNSFNLEPGQWTDDTSMGLCVADSLLINKTFDGSDMRVRFWNWWNRGYNNAFRLDKSRSKSIGLGTNTAVSLSEITDSAPCPRCKGEGEDAGNGSLIRLAAVPLYFFRDLDLCMRVCAESSYVTHPGHVAADACSFLGYLIAKMIGRPLRKLSPARFLDRIVAQFLARPEVGMQPELARLLRSSEPPESCERCWNWRDPKGPFLEETIQNRGNEYNGRAVNPEYMGSFSMDGLAIALHCFYHTRTFMAAITKCVNFLGDADSTAAICGQIAGCFYGVDAIDSRLVKSLNQWDEGDIGFRGALVFLLGCQVTDEMKAEARLRSCGALAIDELSQLPPCPPETSSIAEPPAAQKANLFLTQIEAPNAAMLVGAQKARQPKKLAKVRRARAPSSCSSVASGSKIAPSTKQDCGINVQASRRPTPNGQRLPPKSQTSSASGQRPEAERRSKIEGTHAKEGGSQSEVNG